MKTLFSSFLLSALLVVSGCGSDEAPRPTVPAGPLSPDTIAVPSDTAAVADATPLDETDPEVPAKATLVPPEATLVSDIPVQPAPPPAETPAEPAVSEEPAAPTGGPDPQLIAQGRDVYGGSGNCFACHGPDATGTPIGPDLTDAAWLNITGAVTPASIAAVIRTGVVQPVQFPAPMPPMGGGALTDEQVHAVSAYVYSLSR
jgi:mono/diheme cytochrome c family protein